MRRLICLLILLLFLSSIAISDSAPANNKWIIDQEQIDYDDGFVPIYGGLEVTQSFMPSREKLNCIELYISKCGRKIDDLTVILRKYSGEEIYREIVPWKKVKREGGWVKILLPNIEVEEHREYYIVCKAGGGDEHNCYRWHYGKSSFDPYPCGKTNVFGKNVDFAFRTYGLGEGKIERWAIAMGFGFEACREDARYLRDILNSHSPEIWPLDHIKVYDTEDKAIWSNILDGLRWIAAQEDSNDITLWQSAGHGSEVGLYDDHYTLPYTYLDAEFDKFEGSVVIMIVACFSYKAHTYLGEPGRIIMTGRSEHPPPASKEQINLQSTGYTYFISRFTRPERGGAWGNGECDVNKDGWISAEEAFYYVLNTYSWPGYWGNGYLYPSMYDGIEGELPITFIRHTNHPPSTPTKPIGPSEGTVYTPYTFTTSSMDPDSDRIAYLFYWGDGSFNWSDACLSGENVTLSHVWERPGTYSVVVKAVDEVGAESEWSEPLNITIYPDTENPTIDILQPKKGYLYILGKEITPTVAGLTIVIGEIEVKVAASDNIGVERVEFYIDNTLKEVDYEAPYSWKWRESTIGWRILEIRAYDITGNMAMQQVTVLALI